MAFPESIQNPIQPLTSATEMESSQTSYKSNHVSSVLLYDIPIVSLYIEGQERLCLAQISNTLLKQFSYNEIHNRRVALGITCVQCTPVQLEILRRAGAMPVSSRRCGMITRREAERLCKSFLGDNTPPRLPDDFAFNVQHKCAWGCRGLFLPSRYNSSRAKCIKCSYCGMFFSPNKFIFHSHRITTSDRYIQPDAANFNSWRRHMTLSGHGQEEKIIHAWEDVKAMFNGGTRKRLVGCNNGNINNLHQNSPGTSETTKVTADNAYSSLDICESDPKLPLCDQSTFSKTTADHPYDYSTVTAAAAVVGVTTVAATVGVPFNLHRSAVLSPLQSLRNEHELSIMPLSRNLVVDYTMWHQQNQKHLAKKLNGGECTNGLESFPLSCVKPVNTSTSTSRNGLRLLDEQPFNIKHEPQIAMKTRRKSSEPVNTDLSDFSIPSLLSASAFKPVVASTAIVSTSLYTSRSNDFTNSNIYISPTQSTRTTAVFTQSTKESSHRVPSGTILSSSSNNFLPNFNSAQFCTDKEQPERKLLNNNHISSDLLNNKKLPFSNVANFGNTNNIGPNENDDNNDDDEVVDIETTEDDTQIVNDKDTFNIACSHSPDEMASLSTSHSHSRSPNADVDVDGFTTDTEDQFDLKSSICSYDINISHSNKMSSIAINTIEDTRPIYSKYNEDANGINEHFKRLSRKKSSNQPRELHIKRDKNGTEFSSQPRVPFPVFLKSNLNSIRHRASRHAMPIHKQFYCIDTIGRSNENGAV